MRLYLLHLALRPETGTPVPGYLIQTATENILVDSGFPNSFVSVDGTTPKNGWLMREEDRVVNRLAQIGLKPSDIGTVICTHLDVDEVAVKRHGRLPGDKEAVNLAADVCKVDDKDVGRGVIALRHIEIGITAHMHSRVCTSPLKADPYRRGKHQITIRL